MSPSDPNDNPASQQRRLGERLHEDRLFGALLSFVSGFVDTAGFITLFGLFTAHVTGNLVMVGADLDPDDKFFSWSRVAVLPIFMAAVVASTILVAWARQHGHSAIRWLLWFEAVSLAVYTTLGVYWKDTLTEDNQALVLGVAAAAVVAMAIQVTLNKETPRVLAPTNVMTSNLAVFVIDLTRLLMRPTGWWVADDRLVESTRNRIRLMGLILLGFSLGVAAAGLTVPRFGYVTLVVPLVMVALLAATRRDEIRE